jgi:hypothetical protein
MPANTPIPATGDIRIDALVSANQLSFAANRTTGTAAEITYNVIGMSAAQQAAISQTLTEISSQVGVTFKQVAAGGLLQYALSSDLGLMESGGPITGVAHITPQNITVYLSTSAPGVDDLAVGEGKRLLLHETGHALGLKHPGIYSSADTGPTLAVGQATGDHTIMAYQIGTYTHLGDYDVLALQYLYGASGNAPANNPITVENYVSGSTTSGSFFNDTLSIDMGQLFGKGVMVDAGTGVDTLKVNVASTQVTFLHDQYNSMVYNAGGGKTATAWTTSVERFQFTDKAVAMDATAEQAYRLYKAAFDRKPDLGGLGYWINEMDKGASLESVSNSFINSAEFKSLYGTTHSNTDFITALYQNILDRNPDAGGLSYWQGQLNTGAMTEAGVLASFSESNENKIALSGVVQNGIEYLPV